MKPVNMKFGHFAHYDCIRQDLGIKQIVTPEEYKGEEYAEIACTQLDDKTEQKKIVKRWCDLLRAEQLPLRFVWFVSRHSQQLFDAICHQQNLEGLWIKWGVYPDVSKLANLTSLKYLHLGGGASIPGISSVHGLKELRCLETSHLYKITDYSFLANLEQVDDLTIEGDPYSAMKHVVLDSLRFLESMPQLKRLELSMMRVKDHSYLPVTKLNDLVSLSLPADKDLDKDSDAFEKFRNIM
jgi:hypothetical protein